MSPVYLLYYIPLIVAISLVLAATRHEKTEWILQQAVSQMIWFTGFMMTVGAVLWVTMCFI